MSIVNYLFDKRKPMAGKFSIRVVIIAVTLKCVKYKTFSGQ